MNTIQYYSQYGQDRFLDQHVFDANQPGVFLDIGAHDGICFSNSYIFEKDRKWIGICVEPLPSVFARLKENRKCILVNGVIGEKNGKETFLSVSGYPEMLSGIVRNYQKKHQERIEREIKERGGSSQYIEVESFNINDLLKKNGIKHVNYCNIDTEGSEYEILKSIDFNEVQIDVFTVEGNFKLEKLKMILFMMTKGYRFVGTLMSDMVFMHKNFQTSMKEVKSALVEQRRISKLRGK